MFIKRRSNPELEPTRIPTALDIAWSAGVYEGEGSVRGHQKRAVTARISQKDPEVLYRFKSLFGGNVGEYANPGMKRTGMIHIWQVAGDKARLFLALIYPWLTARRRKQVDMSRALEFLCGDSPDNCSREELLTKMLAYYEEQRKTTINGMSHEQRKLYWRDIARNWRARNGVKSNKKLWQKREAEANVIPITKEKVS